MLPKLLTENLCSLVANQDRFAFSVIAELTPKADVVRTQFKKTIIRSRGALTFRLCSLLTQATSMRRTIWTPTTTVRRSDTASICSSISRRS